MKPKGKSPWKGQRPPEHMRPLPDTRKRYPRRAVAPNTDGCVHHWIIATPEGATSHGQCKKCGLERDWYNAHAIERDAGQWSRQTVGHVPPPPMRRGEL